MSENFDDFDDEFQKLSESFDQKIENSRRLEQTSLELKPKAQSKNSEASRNDSSRDKVTFDDLKFEDSDSESEVSTEESLTSLGEYFSIEHYPKPYCDIVNQMPRVCLEMSILELWANDGTYDDVTDVEIAALTKESILDKLNGVTRSGIFQTERNFTDLLGGVRRDSGGRIVSAEATVIRWFVKMNATEALRNPLVERDEPVDLGTLEFEGDMLTIMLNRSGYPEGLESFPNVQRSFADVAKVAVFGDGLQLVLGYCILFFYVMLTLGKFGCIDQRAYLSTASILGIIMGIIVSYGFCSAIGLFYGPMHNVLPFLLLGIGIDDMFVIVQSWDTLRDDEKDATLIEKFGKTLSHSGG